jgi:hypothetical protein
MNINSPIKLSNYADQKKLSEMSDRNFTSVWQILTDLIKRVLKLENTKYAEVVSATSNTVTIRVDSKNYKLKIEV